ncbi:MAG: hypothetical protein FJY86_01540 [Candidatus Diapherotrites archaeon]|uniref:DUF1616 domain-containing protein n=1 Tax=Candidatus Iainarchaeum sp. TaxID=3101447 RepID=A0A8T4C6U1_9ARCH|nr:hypothetical protein [Candidatus Diapherotrites archaeon]
MRSPLDDVPQSPALDVETASLRVLGVIALVLVLFVAGYLFFLPNRPAEGYSTLAWGKTPVFAMDANRSLLNVGSFVFSVELSSFELREMIYRVSVEYDSRIIASKNVSLFPRSRELIDFSIPVQLVSVKNNELRVRVSKINSDMNVDKDDTPLELVYRVVRE